jgi:hypothetical protein
MQKVSSSARKRKESGANQQKEQPAKHKAQRKESGVDEQKEQPAKQFKLPAGPLSPLVPIPTRSTGIRMMLSPKMPHPPSTSGTIDISSSNGEVPLPFPY